MNNFLLSLTAIAVFILATLFAVPPFVDWNAYRGVFEEEVSRLLDREVRVQGRVSVRILPVPFVSFETVRIADQPGISGSFARADQFKMWLSVPPLLRGVIEARQIELEKPVVRLRIQADGTGNWRELQIQDHALAFLPRDVALNSLAIQDGTVLIEHHTGEEISRIGAITGELSATALRGPFKFIGTVKAGTAAHEIRFSTAPLEDDGNIRFRGTARDAASGLTHTIDGTVNDPLGSANVTGRLKSRAGTERRPVPAGGADGDAWDLTAGIMLDANAFRLDDIAMTFESRERLQTLTGSAVTNWQDGVITRTELKAPWLDLDAVAGTGAGDAPLGVIERLLTRSLEPLGAGVTSVALDIEQGRLAGATVSGLEARLMRRSGVTRIERLRVSLPGLTAVALDGFVDSTEAGLEFDGDIVLRSAKFDEFARWLTAGSADLPADFASPFLLNGGLRLRPGKVSLQAASASIAGEPLEGAVGYDATAARPVVTADLETGAFDLRVLGRDLLAPEWLAAKLGLGAAAPGRDTDPEGLPLLAGTDLALKLSAARLSDGARVFEDVGWDLERRGDRLEIARFGMVWAPGLGVDLSGSLGSVGADPEGRIAATVRAAGRPAAENLAALFSLALGAPLPPEFLSVRTPLRLALDATLGRAAASAANGDADYPTVITADGETAGARLRLTARTAGPLAGWLGQPAHVDARLDGPDAVGLARLLLGDGPEAASGKPASGGAGATPATVILSAVGVPERAMKSYARFEAKDLLAADYTGDIAVAAADRLGARWSGAIAIDRADTRVLARLLWPPLAPRIAASPVAGRLEVAGGTGALVVKPDRLRLAGSRLTGELSISRDAPLTGHLEVSKASLAALASLVLDETAPADPPAGRPEAGGSPAESPDAPPWPTGRFDFAHFDGASGDVRISLARLTGAEGATLARDLAGRLKFSGDGVTVSGLSGRIGAGRLGGNWTLSRTAAGTALEARVEAGALPLAMFAPGLDAGERLAGHATFVADIAGRALSPAALAGTLKGEGTLHLAGVRVPGLRPETVATLAARVIAGEIEPDGLGAEFQERVGEAAVDLAPPAVGPTIAFTIENGVLNLPPIAVEGPAGVARNETALRLRDWRFESRWVVSAGPLPKPEVEDATLSLPAVTLGYEGSLGRLAEITPRLDLGDLERELVVARMEANVARLERLRREDEERAREESERQRAREDEERRAREAEAARIERERADGLRPGDDGWQSRVNPREPGPSGGERQPRAPRPL